MTSPDAVVRLDGIGRTFPGTPPIEVLRSIDLTIEPAEYVSIVGPSGSGKSTLLNLLGLLDRPTAGSYYLDGVEVSNLSDNQRTALRGARLGFVFQSFHLLPHRTIVENVVLAQLYNRTPARERGPRAVAALERVGLGHRLTAFPPTLSGGERQRVAIARALVSKPSLLLADEPTGNLDGETTESIMQLFDQLHLDGLTLIVITHDTEVADRAQRVVTIRDGRLSEGRELAGSTLRPGPATPSELDQEWIG